MFRALPQSRDGWSRIWLFPFQAFPVIAILLHLIFGWIWHIYRRGYEAGGFRFFALYLLLGCAVSFVVLMGAALVQLVMRRYQKAAGNLAFAWLSVVTGMLCMPSFVVA